MVLFRQLVIWLGSPSHKKTQSSMVSSCLCFSWSSLFQLLLCWSTRFNKYFLVPLSQSLHVMMIIVVPLDSYVDFVSTFFLVMEVFPCFPYLSQAQVALGSCWTFLAQRIGKWALAATDLWRMSGVMKHGWESPRIGESKEDTLW